jgi:hypothetical protein
MWPAWALTRSVQRSSLAEQAKPSISVAPELGPQPPCGVKPVPDYPPLGDLAIVKSWSRSDFGNYWKPPECIHWAEDGFTSLITITARFPYASGADALLRHIGAISELAGLRYWSTTHKQWRTLVLDAYSVKSLQFAQRRQDFAPAELKEGKIQYFEQVDNVSGKGLYQLQMTEVSSNRIIFSIENVSTIRYHFIPIFHPESLQSIYFLECESDHVWRYYSIFRITKNVNHLIAGSEASAVNRAVAFYRYFVGIPTTQEPPSDR